MNLNDHKPEFQKVIDHVKIELGALRTGRANPAILDMVMVEAYGSKMPIKGVGSVGVPDARTLTIEPWDKSLLKEIERAIVAANIGLSPVVDGTVVRLNIPQLTEENRKELVKLMGKRLEEARVAVRGVREKVRAAILSAEEAKKIREDERFKMQEDLEKMVAQFNENIKKMGEEKEKEIMTV